MIRTSLHQQSITIIWARPGQAKILLEYQRKGGILQLVNSGIVNINRSGTNLE